ncbi:MAG: hypothetical protein AAF806_22570, partial [Bacteroidota bacterium]
MRNYLLFILLLHCTFGLAQIEYWLNMPEETSYEQYLSEIAPLKHGLTDAEILEKVEIWSEEEELSGKEIYEAIIGWNTFQSLPKTGVIIEQSIKL